MELLDVRHTGSFYTFRLRTPHSCSIGFRSGEILGHSITFSFLSKAVVILVVCFGSLSCRSAQFLKAGYHVLFQNVTLHVGIHVFLNETQLSSTSNTHAATYHDATITMLDCRQDTMFLVLLTRGNFFHKTFLFCLEYKDFFLDRNQQQNYRHFISFSFLFCLCYVSQSANAFF